MEYYVHLSGETLEKLEDAISGEPVEIEALSVTENGTYTAEQGKAYSPVVVEVEGGSSDFSTAEVTFSSDSICSLTIPIVIKKDAYGDNLPPYDIIMANQDVISTVSQTLTIPVGNPCWINVYDIGLTNVIISGDASWLSDMEMLEITGDATIVLQLEPKD